MNLNHNKIHLSSGTVCKFSDEHCIDRQVGYTFWTHFSNEHCLTNKYDTLYSGTVTKTLFRNNELIYTINTFDLSFSLKAIKKIKFCDRIITKAEHPKLFIYEKEDNALFDNDIRQERDFVKINIFSYTNAKFVHVEKHFRMKFKSIYINMFTKMCEVERR